MDFSLKCTRPDAIFIDILRRDEKGWRRIGKATIVVKEGLKTAEWMDIVIGQERSSVLSDFIFPTADASTEPSDLKFRNKGIGSKVVRFMLEYLKERGIEEVHGDISKFDDVTKATDFWKKNGFEVTPYETLRQGVFVAGIFKRLT